MVIETPQEDACAELRAEFARRQITIYRVAPVVGLHPGRLGAVLRGHIPITQELVQRIREAIKTVSAGER